MGHFFGSNVLISFQLKSSFDERWPSTDEKIDERIDFMYRRPQFVSDFTHSMAIHLIDHLNDQLLMSIGVDNSVNWHDHWNLTEIKTKWFETYEMKCFVDFGWSQIRLVVQIHDSMVQKQNANVKMWLVLDAFSRQKPFYRRLKHTFCWFDVSLFSKFNKSKSDDSH